MRALIPLVYKGVSRKCGLLSGDSDGGAGLQRHCSLFSIFDSNNVAIENAKLLGRVLIEEFLTGSAAVAAEEVIRNDGSKGERTRQTVCDERT